MIERWILGHSTKEYDPTETLAQKARISTDLLSRIREGSRESVSFTTADRLVCAMGAVMLWHYDPVLAPLYQQCDLDARNAPVEAGLCQCPGCTNRWEKGRKGKKYCSESCAARASAYRRGIRPMPGESAQKKRDGRGGYVCKNGHERTPENTYTSTRKVGDKQYVTRTCRECQRIKAKELYDSGRSARSAQAKRRVRAAGA